MAKEQPQQAAHEFDALLLHGAGDTRVNGVYHKQQQQQQEESAAAAWWEFDMGEFDMGASEWGKLKPSTSKLLEDAHAKLLLDDAAPSGLEFGAGQFRYKADLQSMTQVNLETKRKRAIRRRVISRDEDVDALFE